MYKMKITVMNDMAQEWEYDKEFDTIDSVYSFIFPLMEDFVRNEYRIVFDNDSLEVTSASRTHIYRWAEELPKLNKLVNRPSPFNR